MKSHSLAPLPATLALSAFLVAPGFAAETTPAEPAATPSTTPATAPATVSKETLGARNVTETQSAIKLAETQGTTTPPPNQTGETAKVADVTVRAKREVIATGYQAPVSMFRRPTPIAQTPQAITVVSQQVLRDRNAIDMKDALKNTPGITMNAGEGGNSGGDSFNIRGFNAQSDIFIDGVRDTALYSRDAFSLEQVEIARGSSGVYQGRGSTGGAVNLVSRFAHAGDAGNIDLAVNSARSLRGIVDVNYDLSEHHEAAKPVGVAARLVVMGQEGGMMRAPDADDSRRGFMPSVALGLGQDTTIVLAHQHYTQESDGDYGIPFGTAFANGPAPVDKQTWYGVKGVSHDDTAADITSAIITTKLDENHTVRNLTRYNDNLRDTIIYRPSGNTIPASTPTTTNTRNGTDITARTVTASPNVRYVETQVLSNQTDYVGKFKNGDRGMTLNIGAELQQERSSNLPRLAVGPNPVFALDNPNTGAVPTQSFAFSGAKTTAQAETYGVYLNDTLHLLKEVDLIGGIRYDQYNIKVKTYAANLTNTNGGPPTAVAAPAATTVFKSSDWMLGLNAGLVLKPTDQLNFYGRIANSFQPSGADLTLSAANQNLAPEETMLYEVGTKWEPIHDRLTFNLAYFIADKFNLRQTDTTVVPQVTNLDGRAVSQGIEFSAAGAVTKKWNVFGGFAFMDTEVKKSATVANIGKELVNTPDFSATLWTTYDLGDGWAIGGGARYTGKRWANSTNTIAVGDYWVGDLAVYKQINNWCRAQVNLDNFTDETYMETARQSGWNTPGAGRTISASVRMSF